MCKFFFSLACSLKSIINFNLLVNDLNTFLDDFIAWALEIWWSIIVPVDEGINSVLFQPWSTGEVKEIKSYYLIKIFFEGLVIIKLCSIIELSKLEYHLDNLWLVLSREAVVTFATKNSLNALIHHVRANWIKSVVKSWVEICVLIWHDYNRFVILYFLRLVGF